MLHKTFTHSSFSCRENRLAKFAQPAFTPGQIIENARQENPLDALKALITEENANNTYNREVQVQRAKEMTEIINGASETIIGAEKQIIIEASRQVIQEALESIQEELGSAVDERLQQLKTEKEETEEVKKQILNIEYQLSNLAGRVGITGRETYLDVKNGGWATRAKYAAIAAGGAIAAKWIWDHSIGWAWKKSVGDEEKPGVLRKLATTLATIGGGAAAVLGLNWVARKKLPQIPPPIQEVGSIAVGIGTGIVQKSAERGSAQIDAASHLPAALYKLLVEGDISGALQQGWIFTKKEAIWTVTNATEMFTIPAEFVKSLNENLSTCNHAVLYIEAGVSYLLGRGTVKALMTGKMSLPLSMRSLGMATGRAALWPVAFLRDAGNLTALTFTKDGRCIAKTSLSRWSAAGWIRDLRHRRFASTGTQEGITKALQYFQQQNRVATILQRNLEGFIQGSVSQEALNALVNNNDQLATALGKGAKKLKAKLDSAGETIPKWLELLKDSTDLSVRGDINSAVDRAAAELIRNNVVDDIVPSSIRPTPSTGARGTGADATARPATQADEALRVAGAADTTTRAATQADEALRVAGAADTTTRAATQADEALRVAGAAVSQERIAVVLGTNLNDAPEATRAIQNIGINTKLADALEASPEFANTLVQHLKNAANPETALMQINNLADELADPQILGKLGTSEIQCTRIVNQASDPVKTATALSKTGRIMQTLNAAGVAADIFAIYVTVQDIINTNDVISNAESRESSEEYINQLQKRYAYHAAELGVATTGAVAGSAVMLGVGGTVAAPVALATLPISAVIYVAYRGHLREEDKIRSAADWAAENSLVELLVNVRNYSIGERLDDAWWTATANGEWINLINPMVINPIQFNNANIEQLAKDMQSINEEMIRGMVIHATTVVIPEKVLDENGEPRDLNPEEKRHYANAANAYVEGKVAYIMNQIKEVQCAVSSYADVAKLMQNAESYALLMHAEYNHETSNRELPADWPSNDLSMEERATTYGQLNGQLIVNDLFNNTIINALIMKNEETGELAKPTLTILESNIQQHLLKESKPLITEFSVRCHEGNIATGLDGNASIILERYMSNELLNIIQNDSAKTIDIIRNAEGDDLENLKTRFKESIEESLKNIKEHYTTTKTLRERWDAIPAVTKLNLEEEENGFGHDPKTDHMMQVINQERQDEERNRIIQEHIDGTLGDRRGFTNTTPKQERGFQCKSVGELYLIEKDLHTKGDYWQFQCGWIFNKYLYIRCKDGQWQTSFGGGGKGEWSKAGSFEVSVGTDRTSARYNQIIHRLKELNAQYGQ